MTSELDLQPSAGFALDASETILRDVTVSERCGLAHGASRRPAQHDPAGGQDAVYDVDIRRAEPRAARPVRAQLDPGGVLPGRIETLDYSAEMVSTAPGTSAPSRIGARRSRARPAAS
jgi:hypothetical protein